VSNFVLVANRLLKPIIIYKSETLAVSDRAFYLIQKEKVYRRDTVFNILVSKKLSNSKIVNDIKSSLRKLDIDSVVSLVPVIYSPYLAEKLFSDNVDKMSVNDFVMYLLNVSDSGSQRYRLITDCRETGEAFPPAVFILFKPLLDVLAVLGKKYTTGRKNDGTPCIVVEKKGIEYIFDENEEG